MTKATWLSTLALSAFACAASAQTAATTAKMVNLRAGPDRAYPVVAVLPPNMMITVQGCVADYRWCDVIAGMDRGWVYAGNIEYTYQGREVPVLGYGVLIGIGIVSFVFADYWGEHYRHRPWYRDRDHWARRPPPVHVPPPRAYPPMPPAPPRQSAPPGERHPPPSNRLPSPPPGERHPPGNRPPPAAAGEERRHVPTPPPRDSAH